MNGGFTGQLRDQLTCNLVGKKLIAGKSWFGRRLVRYWGNIVFRFRLEEFVALFFFVPAAILTLTSVGRPGFDRGTLERLVWIVVVFLFFVTVVKRNHFLQIVRDALPFGFCIAIYTNLHDLIHFVNPRDQDRTLLAVEQWLFGGQPVVWLERFISNDLTNLLTVCYSLFFFYAPLLALDLYLRKRYQQFREFLTSVILCFFLGYFGYILVPAVGPRYTLADQFSRDLSGSTIAERLRETIDVLESTRRDCFPSLHTAVSLLTLSFAWRFEKWFFVLFFPFAVGLFFSTVYLRYHYLVDILAGGLLALFCFWTGPRLANWWEQARRKNGFRATLPRQ